MPRLLSSLVQECGTFRILRGARPVRVSVLPAHGNALGTKKLEIRDLADQLARRRPLCAHRQTRQARRA